MCSLIGNLRDENLKVEGVRGQTQTRSERGETDSKNWAVVWTGQLEETRLRLERTSSVFRKKKIEMDLRNLEKDDIYRKDKIVPWAMSVLWQSKSKRTTK